MVIILLVTQFLISEKETAENFTSLDYTNHIRYPLINPTYGYREYWNYSYPYDIDHNYARVKNIIKRFGNPLYYTLFQVPEKQYQYGIINKYLEEINDQ